MTKHETVLREEVIEYLKIKPGKWYVDATLGGGGHTIEILQRGGKVVAFDQDPDAVREFRKVQQKAFPEFTEDQIVLVNKAFSNITDVLTELGIRNVDGVIFDLGISTDQLEDENKGFSFMKEGPLDMRMDSRLQVTASDLINGLTEDELIELFVKYGEVYRPKLIARRIIDARENDPIKTTTKLASVIRSAYGSLWERNIHPATQVFQALRIAVNDEMNALTKGLQDSIELLVLGGRVCVISFHSIEDRLVKHTMQNEEKVMMITKKPIVPGEIEIEQNARARSAKLRVAEKIK